MEEFLKEIDFEKLKVQKEDLQKVITYCEKNKLDSMKESMVGLLHLVDGIQDTAVDKYGYNEKDVIHSEEEE